MNFSRVPMYYFFLKKKVYVRSIFFSILCALRVKKAELCSKLFFVLNNLPYSMYFCLDFHYHHHYHHLHFDVFLSSFLTISH